MTEIPCRENEVSKKQVTETEKEKEIPENRTAQRGNPADSPTCAQWMKPEGLVLLRGWARDGYTDQEIAGRLGITTAVLQDWKHTHAAIAEALKLGREIADYMVEEALFRTALGYEVTESEEKMDAKGAMARTSKTKHVPGSTTLQMFWLKNRRSDRWGDRSAEELDEASAERSLESFRRALAGILNCEAAGVYPGDLVEPEDEATADAVAVRRLAYFTGPQWEAAGANPGDLAEPEDDATADAVAVRRLAYFTGPQWEAAGTNPGELAEPGASCASGPEASGTGAGL